MMAVGDLDGLSPNVAAVARGAYSAKDESAIRGSGYAVESLEAALWCFAHTDSFDAAVLRAANLGDDADTTAAITGQVAGAYYGIDAIPLQWRARLHMGDEIDAMARGLAARARQPVCRSPDGVG